MKLTLTLGGLLAAAIVATQAAIVAQGPSQAAAPRSDDAVQASAAPAASPGVTRLIGQIRQDSAAPADLLGVAGQATELVVVQESTHETDPGHAANIVIQRPQVAVAPQSSRYTVNKGLAIAPQVLDLAGQAANPQQTTQTVYRDFAVHSGYMPADNRELAFEAEAQQLAYALLQGDSENEKGLRDKLREVTQRHFDYRMEKRHQEMAELEKRLEKVRQEVERRSELREEIVDKRVADLLQEGNELDWNRRPSESARNPTKPLSILHPSGRPLGFAPASQFPYRIEQSQSRLKVNRDGTQFKPSNARSPGPPDSGQEQSGTVIRTETFPSPARRLSDARSPAGWADAVIQIINLRGRLQEMDGRIMNQQTLREKKRLEIELQLSEDAIQVALRLLKNDLDVKKTEYDLTRSEAQRLRMLFEEGVVSDEELNASKLKSLKSEQELTQLVSLLELAEKAIAQMTEASAGAPDDAADAPPGDLLPSEPIR